MLRRRGGAQRGSRSDGPPRQSLAPALPARCSSDSRAEGGGPATLTLRPLAGKGVRKVLVFPADSLSTVSLPALNNSEPIKITSPVQRVDEDSVNGKPSVTLPEKVIDLHAVNISTPVDLMLEESCNTEPGLEDHSGRTPSVTTSPPTPPKSPEETKIPWLPAALDVCTLVRLDYVLQDYLQNETDHLGRVFPVRMDGTKLESLSDQEESPAKRKRGRPHKQKSIQADSQPTNSNCIDEMKLVQTPKMKKVRPIKITLVKSSTATSSSEIRSEGGDKCVKLKKKKRGRPVNVNKMTKNIVEDNSLLNEEECANISVTSKCLRPRAPVNWSVLRKRVNTEAEAVQLLTEFLAPVENLMSQESYDLSSGSSSDTSLSCSHKKRPKIGRRPRVASKLKKQKVLGEVGTRKFDVALPCKQLLKKPPQLVSAPPQLVSGTDPPKMPKNHRGWPKGKPRYPRGFGAPKPPVSCFVHFLNARRDAVRAENHDITFSDLSRKLAVEWGALMKDDKTSYHEQAKRDKERYEKEILEYQQTESYKQYLLELEAKSCLSLEDTPDMKENVVHSNGDIGNQLSFDMPTTKVAKRSKKRKIIKDIIPMDGSAYDIVSPGLMASQKPVQLEDKVQKVEEDCELIIPHQPSTKKKVFDHQTTIPLEALTQPSPSPSFVGSDLAETFSGSSSDNSLTCSHIKRSRLRGRQKIAPQLSKKLSKDVSLDELDVALPCKQLPEKPPLLNPCRDPHRIHRGWPKGKPRYPKGFGAPKPPLSGFACFRNTKRETVCTENPDITFSHVSKKLAAEWGALEEDDKVVYQSQAKKDKKRYEKEILEYKKTESYQQYLLDLEAKSIAKKHVVDSPVGISYQLSTEVPTNEAEKGPKKKHITKDVMPKNGIRHDVTSPELLLPRKHVKIKKKNQKAKSTVEDRESPEVLFQPSPSPSCDNADLTGPFLGGSSSATSLTCTLKKRPKLTGRKRITSQLNEQKILGDVSSNELNVALSLKQISKEPSTKNRPTDPPKNHRGWPKGKPRYPKGFGAPKPPSSGFVCFRNKRRETVCTKNPDITFSDLSRKLASEWVELVEDDRVKYHEQAKRDKERYAKEFSDYKKTKSYKQYLQSQETKSSLKSEYRSTSTQKNVADNPADLGEQFLMEVQTHEVGKHLKKKTIKKSSDSVDYQLTSHDLHSPQKPVHIKEKLKKTKSKTIVEDHPSPKKKVSKQPISTTTKATSLILPSPASVDSGLSRASRRPVILEDQEDENLAFMRLSQQSYSTLPYDLESLQWNSDHTINTQVAIITGNIDEHVLHREPIATAPALVTGTTAWSAVPAVTSGSMSGASLPDPSPCPSLLETPSGSLSAPAAMGARSVSRKWT